MAGSNHSQWASSPHYSQKKLLINDIVSKDHQISKEFFQYSGMASIKGSPGLACAINSNLIKICRLEWFQLKAWVFCAPTPHFFMGSCTYLYSYYTPVSAILDLQAPHPRAIKTYMLLHPCKYNIQFTSTEHKGSEWGACKWDIAWAGCNNKFISHWSYTVYCIHWNFCGVFSFS